MKNCLSSGTRLFPAGPLDMLRGSKIDGNFLWGTCSKKEKKVKHIGYLDIPGGGQVIVQKERA